MLLSVVNPRPHLVSATFISMSLGWAYFLLYEQWSQLHIHKPSAMARVSDLRHKVLRTYPAKYNGQVVYT